ncbi:hypothetical protein GA0115251_104710, partial [Streptomyces sp. TverLS-915]
RPGARRSGGGARGGARTGRGGAIRRGAANRRRAGRGATNRRRGRAATSRRERQPRERRGRFVGGMRGPGRGATARQPAGADAPGARRLGGDPATRRRHGTIRPGAATRREHGETRRGQRPGGSTATQRVRGLEAAAGSPRVRRPAAGDRPRRTTQRGNGDRASGPAMPQGVRQSGGGAPPRGPRYAGGAATQRSPPTRRPAAPTPRTMTGRAARRFARAVAPRRDARRLVDGRGNPSGGTAVHRGSGSSTEGATIRRDKETKAEKQLPRDNRAVTPGRTVTDRLAESPRPRQGTSP